MSDQLEISFNGAALAPELDDDRLSTQLSRVWGLCKDSRWRTLAEIAKRTGDPEASVSAQLRHLRKQRFGSHEVLRRRRGEPSDGLFEYCLIPNPRTADKFEELLRCQVAPF